MGIIRRGLCIVLLLAAVITMQTSAFAVDSSIVEPNYFETMSANPLDMAQENQVIVKPSDVQWQSEEAAVLSAGKSMGYGSEVFYLPPNSRLTLDVRIKEPGGYHIHLNYFIPEATMRGLSLGLLVNGQYPFYESRNMKLPAVWRDATQDYEQDRFGNDIYPSPERVFRWQQAYLNHSIYNLSTPLVFGFQTGMNTITIENNEVPVLLGNITITSHWDQPAYLEYISQYQDASPADMERIVIQGQHYYEKSESYIRGGRSTNYNLQPYDPARSRINHLPAVVWQDPGESVTYRFEVPKDGLYGIHLKYRQDLKNEMPVYKRILVNGRVPFAEFSAHPFPYTAMRMENITLSAGDVPVRIFLTKGVHTLTIESTASPYFETFERLRSVIGMISDTSLQIKMITGNRIDKNRDWNILEFIPGLGEDLQLSAQILREEYEKLAAISGRENIPQISVLKVAYNQLERFSDRPDHLVNNLDQFSQGAGSIAQHVALVLSELLTQPLLIDCIYITGADDSLPPPRIGFFAAAIEEVRKLMLSFTARREIDQNIERDKLNIWVNRSIPHIEVLREMIDNEFTRDTGIPVNVSTMPDEQKLLLANSAGKAPDVVLGASSYRPFDFALRGALYDLRRFDDFGSFIRDTPSEMFVPFIVDDGVYGIPETANFTVLFYRKDILDRLGLNVPETWEDTIKILPALSRYGMDFNTLIANLGGFKHFGATVPFIHQFGGEIYSEDGARVELGHPRTVEAFRLMTDLYTRYSLPEHIANFYNNFRYGVTPIGMADFNMYILLKNAAPEIAEQWGIAPAIGVRNEQGEVMRYYPSVNTACIIMKSTQMADESWELIKWWMAADTQVRYANALQLRYGPEFVWNTANLEAFSQSTAFDARDRAVILKQFEHIREIPRNPAYFAVERELSNAWNKVVFSGLSPRTALDQAITAANREIAVKLKEFGYMDLQGNLIRPFEMATAEKVDQWKE